MAMQPVHHFHAQLQTQEADLCQVDLAIHQSSRNHIGCHLLYAHAYDEQRLIGKRGRERSHHNN